MHAQLQVLLKSLVVTALDRILSKTMCNSEVIKRNRSFNMLQKLNYFTWAAERFYESFLDDQIH